MSLSFCQLWEQMQKAAQSGSPLMDSGEESRAISAVRAGANLRSEDETSFWDDFISLCANTDGMSELLGVPEDKIRGWPTRIKEQLSKLEKHDAENPAQQNDTQVVPTGDNGAFTNVDPQMNL